MGISVEYYFNSGLALPELAQQLNAPLGSRLAPFHDDQPAGEHIGRTAGLQTELDHNIHEDDGELAFGAYRYQLALHTSGGPARLRPIQLPVMLSIVRVMHELWGYDGMLVYDVDVLLARYEPGTFVDMVSGTHLGDFVPHLTAVWSRLPSPERLMAPAGTGRYRT